MRPRKDSLRASKADDAWATRQFRPTEATILLDRVVNNARVVRRLRPNTKLCAVIKADAYGHGSVAVAKVLQQHKLADMFAVALVEEASELRHQGIDTPILTLCGNYRGAYHACVSLQLTPVVGSKKDVDGLEAAAAAMNKTLNVHVELDSGMGRLGALPEEFVALSKMVLAAEHLCLAGMMTHLSHADTLGAPQTKRQLAALEDARRWLQPKVDGAIVVHVINSGALISAPEAPIDMMRCGLSLFGLQPVEAKAIVGIKPVMRLWTRAVAIRTLQPAQSVSYGSQWTAKRKSVIATLPIGYADGFRRVMTHRAQALVRGRRVPIVGAICMDLVMCDVTDIDGFNLDDEVVLIGEQMGEEISAHQVALWAESIPYEVVVNVAKRVPRRFVMGEA